MPGRLAIHGAAPVRTKPFPQWPIFGDAERRALIETLESGAWGKLDGQQVQRFERRFADYHQARHGVAVVNGTVALRIALLAAGIQAGDEVIVPPYTFLATASAVVEANARPVFVDVQLDTANIDPAAIEAAVTPRTKAIICVHLGGLPCDMDAIMNLARRHGLVVIEDACHAHGAEYRGRRVGAIGHLGCFSFQSSKNVTVGEGGIILSNDDALAERCRSIHNCGRRAGGKWYEHHLLGGNYRLGEFQGAVLNAQWDRFDQQAQARETNGRHLAERLAGVPGVTPQTRTADCTRHAYHLFLLRVDPAVLGVERAVFLEALVAEGIPAVAGYPIPLYRQPVFLHAALGPYSGARSPQSDPAGPPARCPCCEILSTEQGVWLPHRLLLGNERDMDDVSSAIDKIVECRRDLM